MTLKDFEGVEIRVIGQGMEKYLNLSLCKYLVFKGSLQFLGSSLDTLTKKLVNTGLLSFKHLRKIHRDRGAGVSSTRAEGSAPVRVYGLLGEDGRTATPSEGGVLLDANRLGHQGRELRARPERLAHLQPAHDAGLSQSLHELYVPPFHS